MVATLPATQLRRFAQRMKRYTYSVESVINEMFDVLTHSDLSHQLVLVSVHSSQLTNMGKDVLQAISKLYDKVILHHVYQ